MTEYMNETTQHLYEDLTLGGVSFWETYGYQRTRLQRDQLQQRRHPDHRP